MLHAHMQQPLRRPREEFTLHPKKLDLDAGSGSLCCIAAKRQRGDRVDVDRLRELIAGELAVPIEAVRDSALFRRDLGADSLDLVELTMNIEEAYDIAVSEEEAASCACVGDVVRLLRTKRPSRPRPDLATPCRA